MAEGQKLRVKTVGVVGAGVSGISSAIHLRRAGLDVTVFERSDHVGGIWYFDERSSRDAAYPSTRPSAGDSPDYEASISKRRDKRRDSSLEGDDLDWDRASLVFAPPGPCYDGLRNNVSTHEMELQTHLFKAGTEEFVGQRELADYLQDATTANSADANIRLNVRVDEMQKVGEKWKVETTNLVKTASGPEYTSTTHYFDAVIVANGNYHAMNIPEIPGLREWKEAYPDRVKHSKLYRRPEPFRDLSVLIVGAGVSSTDITRELGGIAKATYQSSRGGSYDLSTSLLPENTARVGGIKSFNPLASEKTSSSCIPGTVTLTNGDTLTGIDHVILATGYHVSIPFLRSFHNDSLRSSEGDERVLVTDGQQKHNLHKDIFYIPDPTLVFIGVPYHTATWSFFEFQAVAVAQVLAGNVTLPDQAAMRAEYNARLRRKGSGRALHSLKGEGQEVQYVKELVQWVNSSGASTPTESAAAAQAPYVMQGHSQKWLESYGRRVMRMKAMLGATRDSAADKKVLADMVPCV